MRGEAFYGDRIDMWSCGIIMLVMLTGGYPPWADVGGRRGVPPPPGHLREMIQARVPDDVIASDAFWGLLEALLHRNPLERPTAEGALAHAWFA